MFGIASFRMRVKNTLIINCIINSCAMAFNLIHASRETVLRVSHIRPD